MRLTCRICPAQKIADAHAVVQENRSERLPLLYWSVVGIFVVTILLTLFSRDCVAQSPLPFEVSNPKHQKFPLDEAGRIYSSACVLAARTIRPERPPHLQPKFTLVLGAANDQMVRVETGSEIHLKAWNAANFAQAVVLLASREILKNDDVEDIVRTAVLSAQSSVSVRDLKQER